MVLEAGHQFLDLKGGTIEVQVLQPDRPSGTAIILLHEGLGAISMWRNFPERLCQLTGHQVIVYSRFGYGQSSPCDLPRPLRYMHNEAIETLPELLIHVPADQYFLLGHSDGASIAAIYAGNAHDPKLKGLILFAPHFFTEEIALTQIQKAKEEFDQGLLREKLKFHHGTNVDVAFRGWNDAWLNPDFWQWDITEYLPEIRVPTLLIQGSEDQYGTDRQLKVAQQKIPSEVEVRLLPNLKHSPHLEQPEATLPLIADFCKLSGRSI